MIHAYTLRRYLSLMEARGFHACDVLKDANVDADRLQDRSYLIKPEQRCTVIANMLSLTGNTALGLEFGMQARISQFGAVGHVLLSSHSIWEQYRLWLQYGEPLLGLPVVTAIEAGEGGTWAAVYRDSTPQGPEHRFFVEELMGISNQMVLSLTGAPLRLKSVHFDYPPPPHADQYAKVFGCPAEFGAREVKMIVMAPHTEDLFPGADKEFAETCIRYCGQLLDEVSKPHTVAARLQNHLGSHPGEPPTIEGASRALGMSERTLRRRLSEEGTGFQEVVNRYRQDTAIDYLRTQRKTPKEVSYLLGFRHTSDFRRAFKAWTGRPISEFMRETDPA